MPTHLIKLVLLPGLDGTGKLFANLLGQLSDEFVTEVVSYPPDYPLSYPELEQIVSAALKDPEPYLLLAESFSGPIAIRHAATHPPALKALILCNTFASSPLRGLSRVLASAAAPIVFRLPLPSPLARRYLVGTDAPRETVTQLQGALAEVHPSVLTKRLRDVLKCDVLSSLAQVTVPILALQAQQDSLIPATSMQEMQRVQPHLQVVSLPGPHLLLQSNPRSTAGAISAFARDISR